MMRTIQREFSFQSELEKLESNIRRADQFTEGAEFLLSRNPMLGQQIAPDSEVWALPINENTGLPPLVLYCTFDNEKVYFLSIKLHMLTEDDLTDSDFLD